MALGPAPPELSSLPYTKEAGSTHSLGFLGGLEESDVYQARAWCLHREAFCGRALFSWCFSCVVMCRAEPCLSAQYRVPRSPLVSKENHSRCVDAAELALTQAQPAPTHEHLYQELL